MPESHDYPPEHLSMEEWLRRRVRDIDAGQRNLGEIVFARLDAIEKHLGLEPGAWRRNDD